MAYVITKKLKDGTIRYLAAWREKGPDGETKVRYQIYQGFGGKKDALAFARLCEAEAIARPSARDPKATVAEYLAYTWHPNASLNLSHKSATDQLQRVRKICRIIGNVRLTEVGPLHFADLQRSLLATGLAPRTVRAFYKTFRRAMIDAGKWGIIPPDHRPWEVAEMVKLQKKPPHCIRPEDGLRISEHTRQRGNEVYADLIAFLALTGCRIGEGLAIRWKDIDLDAGAVSISRTVIVGPKGPEISPTPKTASGNRTLPLATPLLVILRERKEQRSAKINDLIFPDADGGVRRVSAASKAVSYAAKLAGVEGTAHSLRHGAITALIERGVPLNAVSKLAGHSNPSITSGTYLAWMQEDDSMSAMRAVFDGAEASEQLTE